MFVRRASVAIKAVSLLCPKGHSALCAQVTVEIG